MTAAGSVGAPAVPRRPAGSPRPGRPATWLWLVVALVGQCSPPVRPISWIVVTWQRIRTAGRVLPSTARITVALADLTAETAAEPKKVLVNVLQAVHQAIDDLIGRPLADTTISVDRADHHRTKATGPAADRTAREPAPGHGHRIPVRDTANPLPRQGKRHPKINKTAGSRNLPTRHLNSPAPTFSGRST